MSIEEGRFEIPAVPSAKGFAAPPVDLRGYTLILPCVSIGSVPQLAVDVLLASAHAALGEHPQHLLDFDSRFCMPFVGAGGMRSMSGQRGLRTALQLFVLPHAKLCIVQQRSPVLKARKLDFVHALSRWIKEHALYEVVLLASIDAGLRTDSQMDHPFWRLSVGSQPSPPSIGGALAEALPSYAAAAGPRIQGNAARLPHLPLAGLARMLLQHAFVSTWPSTTALLVFAAEGDNRADAMAMAQLLLRARSSTRAPIKLDEPNDWTLLFGPSIAPGMF